MNITTTAGWVVRNMPVDPSSGYDIVVSSGHISGLNNTIMTDHFIPGIYFLVIESEKDVIRKRFVVQN